MFLCVLFLQYLIYNNLSMVHYSCHSYAVLCQRAVLLCFMYGINNFWWTICVLYALVCGQPCCVVMCRTMFVKFRHRDGYRRNWHDDRFETHTVTPLMHCSILRATLTSAVLSLADCLFARACRHMRTGYFVLLVVFTQFSIMIWSYHGDQ